MVRKMVFWYVNIIKQIIIAVMSYRVNRVVTSSAYSFIFITKLSMHIGGAILQKPFGYLPSELRNADILYRFLRKLC